MYCVGTPYYHHTTTLYYDLQYDVHNAESGAIFEVERYCYCCDTTLLLLLACSPLLNPEDYSAASHGDYIVSVLSKYDARHFKTLKLLVAIIALPTSS